MGRARAPLNLLSVYSMVGRSGPPGLVLDGGEVGSPWIGTCVVARAPVTRTNLIARAKSAPHSFWSWWPSHVQVEGDLTHVTVSQIESH